MCQRTGHRHKLQTLAVWGASRRVGAAFFLAPPSISADMMRVRSGILGPAWGKRCLFTTGLEDMQLLAQTSHAKRSRMASEHLPRRICSPPSVETTLSHMSCSTVHGVLAGRGGGSTPAHRIPLDPNSQPGGVTGSSLAVRCT